MDRSGMAARAIGTATLLAGLLTAFVNAGADSGSAAAYVVAALLTAVGIGLRIEAAIRDGGAVSSPPEPTASGAPGASTTTGS